MNLTIKMLFTTTQNRKIIFQLYILRIKTKRITNEINKPVITKISGLPECKSTHCFLY